MHGMYGLMPCLRGASPLSRKLPSHSPPAADVDSASPSRSWLALTLNGMADFRNGTPSRGASAAPPQHE